MTTMTMISVFLAVAIAFITMVQLESKLKREILTKYTKLITTSTIVFSVAISTLFHYKFQIPVIMKDGVVAGKLVEFTQQGLFVKTWEGSLLTGESGSTTWKFSVTDKATIEKLSSVIGTNKNISIKYKSYVLLSASEGKTSTLAECTVNIC